MLLRRVVGILSENINRRSMDSSNYKYCLMMFCLKAAHFQVDNTATLSYLMKMGETGSREMTALAKKIWEFALPQKIINTAKYLPGKLNVTANCGSRNFQDSRKSLLSSKLFQMKSRNWSTPEIDLFASRTWHQVHTYMAWRLSSHLLPKRL